MANELSADELALLSDRAHGIYEERPHYWKIKLMAQVIRDEIGKYARQRGEHRCGFSSMPKRYLDHAEFCEWVQAELGEVAEIVKERINLLNLLGGSLSSESEDGGDLFSMLGTAHECGQIYRRILLWSQQFREVEMPLVYAPFLSTAANYFDGLLAQLEQVPDALFAETIAGEFDPDEGKRTLTMTLRFGSGDGESLSREIEILGRRLDCDSAETV